MNTSKSSPGGSRYSCTGENKAAKHLQFPFGELFVYSEVCPGKTSPNEDALGVFTLDNEKHGVLVVADGMGGAPLGSTASELVVNGIEKSLKNAKSDDLRAQILDGIEQANKKIIELKVGAGSTCAIVEIANKTIRSYHVGDSSILVVGQRGKLRFQSVSHSPVGYALEAGEIDEQQALHHDDLNLISNYIGHDKMRIDIGPQIRLKQRDTVLLGSDGIFDNLYTDEIVELIRKGPVAKAGMALIDAVNERMNYGGADKPSKHDDATFILFRSAF